MNIIYVAKCCSKEKFSYLQECGVNRDVPQAQKYHRLLVEGIAKNSHEVIVLSAIPTNRQWSKKFFYKKEIEYVDKIKYIYVSFINFPLLRAVSLFINVKKELKRLTIEKHFSIVTDIWHQSMAKATRIISKERHVPVIGIVTDVPGHRSGAYKGKMFSIKNLIEIIAEKNAISNMKRYDGYLLLTKQMNEVVNPLNRPNIILEGHSDISMLEKENCIENKTKPKVILYAGTLHQEYGIRRLVEAFLLSQHDGWELHIYGKGNYADELEGACLKCKEVKYFGLKSNDFIIQEQLKASLIVNPRPTFEDFVKYSFPSKTLEAMCSGTPLLTTKLSGIPEDYKNYLYFFDNESDNGFVETLNRIFCKGERELHLFGLKAKEFAMKEKNNTIQAKKFCEFIKTNF